MLTQDRDEELLLFLEMRRREKDNINHSSTTTMSPQRYPLRSSAADNFSYSENDKSNYDWLVTPPDSPSAGLMNQLDAPNNANQMALKSRLENCQEEERDKKSSSNQSNSSVSVIRRPSSSTSSRSASRPSTPTRRSTTPAKKASTSTPRATLTATVRSTSRPSTPTRRPSSSGTSRTNLTAARATTSTARQTIGSATSTRSNTRPMSAPNTKPASRSSTPTRRASNPTGSSTVLRSKPTKPLSNPALSLGAFPIVRSRPWEPYEMPGFSLEAPSNLRTTLPDRPLTASSGRTRAFGGASSSSRSASIERDVARRQSCSPSRNRAPIGNTNGAVPSLRGRRAKTSNNDGGLGNQMVQSVVNMRKIAPWRLAESGGRRIGGGGGSSAGKSSFGSDGFGFGRNDLSKSSIDMALRHMDVKRGSMTGNFRPSATKVPATSLYSVRSSGTRRNRPVSSSGSSEWSVNILCLDGSDDNLSERSYS